MNPVHAGWAVSAAGAFIFLSLGYLLHGLRRRGEGNRGPDGPDLEEMTRLSEALATAEAGVGGLERALEEERRLHREGERVASIQTESDVARLSDTIEEERKQHSLALRSATNELEDKVVELEGALVGSKLDIEESESLLLGAAQKTIDELKRDLDKERSLSAKLREDLESEKQRTQELLTEHYLMEEELAEERKRSYTATAKANVIRGELEKCQRLMGKGKEKAREFELERSLRDVAEKSWPGGSSDPDSDISEELYWNGEQGRRRSSTPAASGMARTLEQRIRAFQDQQTGTARAARPRDSEHDSVSEKVISGAIGDLVMQLASKRGIHSAVLADAQGLAFTGVGLPRFRDGIAAYAGLLGELTAHSNEFIPMSDISCCSLRDEHDLVFSCWLFRVGNEAFTLSTLSAVDAPNDQVMRNTIDDLALALS